MVVTLRYARSLAGLLILVAAQPAFAQVAVRGDVIHTMAGPPIRNGVVVIQDGKIIAVGPADTVTIPSGFRVLQAKVVTPGLIDAHSTVGLSGILNQKQDQDQLERSAPIQPELRAIDAYNAHDKLITWVRNFGITTLHTGHAPGELISGQTCIVKTTGNTIEAAVVVETAMIAATLSERARKTEKGKSPGTRGKMMALLRAKFIKAREYKKKLATAKEDKKPARDLALEALVRVLDGELPILITAHRAQDIASALRFAEEFGLRLILDGAAEGYMLTDRIKAAGVPVIVHPPMVRAYGEMKNMTFENAARLHAAGIEIAMQSGYESYVPKTRVVLFEAAQTAANGLTFEQALATITSGAAKILGIDDRVGTLEVGKDGDVALYDGDPFEYTSHCVGVIINGEVVSDEPH
ncbi:MAG: amidohydrolase family protein [Planctomycetes bacterium]|nr:amidohydrolase family protein [Planctomycetota bacterium]